MRSPHYFIVTPLKNRRYDNIKKIGDIDFITSTSEEDHKSANRFAKVVETPLGYKGEIEKGDIMVVHHNVFKFYNDMRGRQQSGKSFFKDDLFFIDNDQFFLYKQKGKWKAYDRYCFIKPIPPEESFVMKPCNTEPLMGVMEYPNEYLKSKGIKKGDKVSYTPFNNYEFIVDGERLFRLHDHQVTMKL